MIDTITLKGLRARGYHGVLPAERALGQEFVIDAMLSLDTRGAAEDDDLGKTVDYGALALELTAIVEGVPVNLIETLADRLAAACLRYPIVDAVQISVHKPAAPIPLTFDDVVVTVSRSR